MSGSVVVHYGTETFLLFVQIKTITSFKPFFHFSFNFRLLKFSFWLHLNRIYIVLDLSTKLLLILLLSVLV